MKITYEFDTSSEKFYEYGDSHRLEEIQKAFDMMMCLSNMADKIREWYNHDSRAAIPQEEISEAFYDILRRHNVDLERLVY